MREQYAMMTPEQKDDVLHRNRAYKMRIRHTTTLSDQSVIPDVANGSAYSSPCTPTIHGQPWGIRNPTGISIVAIK